MPPSTANELPVQIGYRLLIPQKTITTGAILSYWVRFGLTHRRL